MVSNADPVVAIASAVLMQMGSVAAAACVVTPLATSTLSVPAGSITLVEQTGSRTITIAAIERLPMVRIVGCSNFPTAQTGFEGVLLADVLEFLGAGDAAAIDVVGIDHYSARIPRGDWLTWPVIVATRIDGRPLSRRQRGPARILYPVDDDARLSSPSYAGRAVWLISQIILVQAED